MRHQTKFFGAAEQRFRQQPTVLRVRLARWVQFELDHGVQRFGRDFTPQNASFESLEVHHF